jgi:glyoxylase I family protein
MASVVGFHHVALTVTSRDESAAWYASTLGLEELFREDADDRRASVMRFPGGGHSVGLVEHTPADPDPFDPRRRGLDHVAFTVASRAALDQWAAELTLTGVEHSGVVEIPTGAILNFKDPDGIALALFWDDHDR